MVFGATALAYHFYPRSPCGERRWGVRKAVGSLMDFYPRSPCGERRSGYFCFPRLDIISIHALLAESDSRTKAIPTKVGNFYPRSPCGERPWPLLRYGRYWHISIHALLAESDPIVEHDLNNVNISIHALLAESDPSNCFTSSPLSTISIHALLAESDGP